jgi:hypothetical protein
MKIRKIWSKRTEDDGGTVKIGNTEMRPVLPINRCGEFRMVFAENRLIFAEIR